MDDFRKLTASGGSSTNPNEKWVRVCFGNWKQYNQYCFQCFCNNECKHETKKVVIDMKIKDNAGVLVYPLFVPLQEGHATPPDISKAVFFENLEEAWEFKNCMEENLDNIHYCWQVAFIQHNLHNKAEWVYVGGTPFFESIYECSSCGRKTKSSGLTRYCGDCGRSMRVRKLNEG